MSEPTIKEQARELLDRFNHFFLQTSGEYDFPNSMEGDLLKMTLKLVNAVLQIPEGSSVRDMQEFLSHAGLADKFALMCSMFEPPAPDSAQAQTCKHGTPYRYECEECWGELSDLPEGVSLAPEGFDIVKVDRGPGWRTFQCPECHSAWSWPTRDYRSPSSEECPWCDAVVTPNGRWPDPRIPVDASGNLQIDYRMSYSEFCSGVEENNEPKCSNE